MKRSCLVGIILLLVACNGAGSGAATSPVPTEEPEPSPEDAGPIKASLGTAFQLGLDQIAVIEEGDFQIMFDAVPMDSRCPSDVECIHSGEVRVTVLIGQASNAGDAEAITIKAFPETPADVVHGDYIITLAAVDPYPISTEVIAEEDYVITLAVVEAE